MLTASLPLAAALSPADASPQPDATRPEAAEVDNLTDLDGS
jgi:hypothetical protein